MIYVLSGGSDLNLKVVTGTSAPASPKENTVWVNTSTAIPSWVLSPTQPSSPESGQVWIKTRDDSDIVTNVLKKNGIWLGVGGVKQYISGAWTNKDAKIYISGAWQDLLNRAYLFESGVGASVSFKACDGSMTSSSEALSFSVSPVLGFATVNTYSVKSGQTLYLEMSTSSLENYGYSYTLTLASTNTDWNSFNNADPGYSAGVIQKKFTPTAANQRTTVSLPITVTGSYYIGGGCYFTDSSSIIKVYNLWIE